jgi:transcriptional/translational regulatory protein YebC/TACO1
MGNAGSVAHLFSKKGDILVPKTQATEDDLMNIVLEHGADDLQDDDSNWEILTDPAVYDAVLEALKAAGYKPEHSEVSMIPANYVKLEGQQARTMFRLMEAMEDYDDVQNVYTNADIDQKDLEEVAG